MLREAGVDDLMYVLSEEGIHLLVTLHARKHWQPLRGNLQLRANAFDGGAGLQYCAQSCLQSCGLGLCPSYR
eukprot:m.933711 g.933711  ORF g.933711 m.933711 type:complete len:72 (+) comp200666_c0_seq1:58-273(+)